MCCSLWCSLEVRAIVPSLSFVSLLEQPSGDLLFHRPQRGTPLPPCKRSHAECRLYPGQKLPSDTKGKLLVKLINIQSRAGQ